MIENTTRGAYGDNELASAAESVSAGSANEEAAALPEELIEIDDDGAAEQDVPGSGAISGGFGFAGLALAIVSLTTSWSSGIVVSHSLDVVKSRATSSLTIQQQLNMYENGWHTQAWWALAIALGAVLFGAGSLLSPSILLSGRAPGWARAGATAAVVIGLVAALLAALTLTGVIGGDIVASASAG